MIENIDPNDPNKEFIADRASRIRRAVYAFGSTFFCLIGAFVLAFMRDTPIALKVSEGFIGFASVMAALYIGAGTVDRSQILSRVLKQEKV